MKVGILLSSSPTSCMLRFKGFNFQSKQVFGIKIVAILEFQLNLIIFNLIKSHPLILNHPSHTSQNSFNMWTKISSHEITIFELKNDGKKWSRIYFEIDRAPSEIPAKLPGQFGHPGQIFLHWAAATLKGLGQFQNKFQTTFYHHF